jgi:hypothetical protein
MADKILDFITKNRISGDSGMSKIYNEFIVIGDSSSIKIPKGWYTNPDPVARLFNLLRTVSNEVHEEEENLKKLIIRGS